MNGNLALPQERNVPSQEHRGPESIPCLPVAKSLIGPQANGFLVNSMTCYFRHLGGIFAKAGITVTPENKKELDKVIHKLVSTKYKDCPATWRAVKKYLIEDEDDFVLKLKQAWNP